MEEHDEQDDQRFDESQESTQYRTCYIFRSSQKRDIERPRKKRKLNGINGTSTSSKLESEVVIRDILQRRQQRFEDFWQQKSGQLNAIANNLNESVLNKLTDFVEISASPRNDGRLQTALIFSGVERIVHGNILGHLRQQLHPSTVVADLQNRHCPNLQIALKAIIKAAIVQHSGFDAYESHLSKHKRLLPLNFDLELLELFTKGQSIQRIIVSLGEIETFDGQLLNELISTLHTWQHRIPFVLLLEVTGMADLLESRLSKDCTHKIHAHKFDFKVADDIDFSLLAQVQSNSGNEARIFIGPSMIGNLFDTGHGQGMTAHSFIHALEYSYMSHFYTNSLSELVDENADLHVSSIARAIRCTSSFKDYSETLLAKPDKQTVEKVHKLLHDDDALVEEARIKIREGQVAYEKACELIMACADLYRCISQISPDLHQSKMNVAQDLYRSIESLPDSETFLALENGLSSITNSQLQRVLKILQPSSHGALALDPIVGWLEQEELNENRDMIKGTKSYINGATANPALTSRKLKMNGIASTSYSKSVQTVMCESMKTKLNSASLDLSQFFLQEAYILSSRAVRCKQALESNPRTALERAMLMPGDYLGCECNTVSHDTQQPAGPAHNHGTTHGKPPPASVVFTLLQEAPTNINVRDLFDAFVSKFEQNHANPTAPQISEEENSGMLKALMAQFYRALAELKLAGFIKASAGTQTKKRISAKYAKTATYDIDYIAKTSWVGI